MFSALRGNVFMIFFLVFSVVVNIIIGVLANTGLLQNTNIIDIQMYYQLALFLGSFTIYILFTKNNVKSVLAFKKISLINIFLIIALSLFIQPIAGFLNLILSYFLPASRISAALPEFLNDTSFLSFIFVIAIIPAFMEEMIFRGVIAAEYKNTTPKRLIFMTGLFFGLMHLDFIQSSYATVLGFYLGFLLVETGSIIAPIIAHFVINASQGILLFVTVFLEKNYESLINSLPDVSIEEKKQLIEKMAESFSTTTDAVMDKEMFLSALTLFGAVLIFVIPIFMVLLHFFRKNNIIEGNNYFNQNIKSDVINISLNYESEEKQDIAKNDYFEDNKILIEKKKNNKIYEVVTVIIIFILFLGISYTYSTLQ